MKTDNPIVFGVTEYDYLLKAILQRGRFERGKLERDEFPDGERYQRIVSEIVGRDVVVVGGTISDKVTLEIYDLSCALVKYGARSLTLLMPYFGYATMERAVKPGEVVTAKTRARLFSSIPQAAYGNRIVMVDLHAAGLPHYFEGGVRPVHLYAKPIIQKLVRGFGGKRFVLASTDAGRAKWVESLAGELGVPAAFVYKRRLDGERTAITGVSASVKGRRVVIYDDMVRTGSSLLQAARAYREAGATAVFAVATHGIFPSEAWRKIHGSGLLDGVGCTDSHPNVLQLPARQIRVHSLAGLLTEYLVNA
ncbi:MAG: ribose-phosphate diphosphokinase [Verrucomicrobiota bacterium]